VFTRPTKKSTPAETKPLNVLTPILSAEQLLSESKRMVLLNTIAQSSDFETLTYEGLCLNLIHQVATYCQRLPEGTVYFSAPGGLLDYLLARTSAATQLFRQHLLADPTEKLSDEQKLWWYAMFSASLLRGIGSLGVDYHIDRYTHQGKLLKSWEPLLETMGQINHHYWFEFSNEENQTLLKKITLFLARKLMPEDGFRWIASNRDVFVVWLALLDEDRAGAKGLGALLDRADAIVIQEELNLLMSRLIHPRRSTPARIGTFVDTTPESLQEKERITGLEFIQWIQNQIETGKFLLNRAPLFVVPGGLLICSEAFHLFSREHVTYKNWHTVQQGLLSLKIHDKSLDKYEQGEGVVVSGAIALPESVALSAALAAFPEKLSKNGTWAPPPTETLKNNFNKGHFHG
jgi:integrating conjugative element relaxase (TIGR03760 family)